MSGNAPAPSLLPGQSPPFAVITPTDHSGVILIVTTFCIAASFLSLIIRAGVRIQFSRSYGWDDVFVFLSFISYVIQGSLTFFAARKGLGRTLQDLTNNDRDSLLKAYYACDVFYIITIWLTKCSVAFLLIRLVANREHTLITKIVLGCTTALGVVAMLIVGLNCGPSHPWLLGNGKCAGMPIGRGIVAAFDIATELALFSVLYFVIHRVQLAANKKAAVLSGFTFRLLLIVPIVVRLPMLFKALASHDSTLKLEHSVIVTQCQICWAIVAATIPCLKPFMMALNTSYGGGHGESHSATDYFNSSGSNNKYSRLGAKHRSEKSEIRSVRSKSLIHSSQLRSQHTVKSEDTNNIMMNDLGSQQNSESKAGLMQSKGATLDVNKPADMISSDSQKSAGDTTQKSDIDQQSLTSSDSQKLIIKREVEWTVKYENRNESGEILTAAQHSGNGFHHEWSGVAV